MMVSISLGLGLTMSPESLVVLGHGAGLMGPGFLMGIGFVVLVHATTIRSYGSALQPPFPPSAEARLLRGAFGPITTLAIFWCSKVVLAVTLSTAVLATAGFVFNEVFIYWFPNFAFAGLLLAVLVVINLLSESLAEKAQVALILLILMGLSSLIVMGLPKAFTAPVHAAHGPESMNFRGALTAFTAFVGFDLALYGRKDGKESATVGKRAMIISLVLPAMVMGFWTWISAMTVSGVRLTESTIPHMIVAREIGGDAGRILMGGVVVSGAAAAVNGFLLALPRNAVGIASALAQPLETRHHGWAARSLLFILCASIAAMLFAGMAGEPVLDVYVRAGIFFWLINTMLVLGAVLHPAHRTGPDSPSKRPSLSAWMTGLALAFLIFALIMLVRGDAERGELIRFMLAGTGASIMSSALIVWILRRWKFSR
jgi:hypothetical protein